MSTRSRLGLGLALVIGLIAPRCHRTSPRAPEADRATGSIPPGDPAQTSDPAALATMLRDDVRRQRASQRLVEVLDAALANAAPPAPAEAVNYVPRRHADRAAPSVRAVLDAAAGELVDAVVRHPRDPILLVSAVEFFAHAREPHGAPVLRIAIANTAPGESADTAATAAAEMLHDAEFIASLAPEDRSELAGALRARSERALPRGTEISYSRAHVIRALGALHVTEAAPTFIATLGRPADAREPDAWSACADALGLLGDARAVGPLLRALFLDRESGADLEARVHIALLRIGTPDVTRRLVALLRGEGPDAQAIAQEFFANDAAARSALAYHAAEALGAMGTDEAVALLVATLGAEDLSIAARATAAKALASIAFVHPAQHEAVTNALRAVLAQNGGDASVRSLRADVALALADLRDLAASPLVFAKLRGATSPAERSAYLRAAALLARQPDVAQLDSIVERLRGEVARAPRAASPTDGDAVLPDVLHEVTPAITLAHRCTDDDVACMAPALRGGEPMAARRVAASLAWRTADTQRDASRSALLDALRATDTPMRGVMLDALDSLWGEDCATCTTREAALAREYEDRFMRPRAHDELLLHLARHGDRESE